MNLENIGLVYDGDTTLKTKSTNFQFNGSIDPEKLIHKMFRIMYKENGIGLAANQVGLTHRHFIMGDESSKWSFFNPEILESSKEEVFFEEGCLSFPNLRIKIKRSETIIVSFQDKNGDQQENRFSGYMARVFQHELDHLNGVCMIDKVSKLKLDMAKRAMQKRMKNVR